MKLPRLRDTPHLLTLLTAHGSGVSAANNDSKQQIFQHLSPPSEDARDPIGLLHSNPHPTLTQALRSLSPCVGRQAG